MPTAIKDFWRGWLTFWRCFNCDVSVWHITGFVLALQVFDYVTEMLGVFIVLLGMFIVSFFL